MGGTWCKAKYITLTGEGGQPEESFAVAAVVVGGGGGKSKSGVANKIQFFLPAGVYGPARLLHETETSPKAASCLAVDTTGKILAAVFGRFVAIYAVKDQGLVKLVEFLADWEPKDPYVNSAAFCPDSGNDEMPEEGFQTLLLATAGDDKVVRVWRLRIRNEHLEEACGPVAELEKEPEQELTAEEAKAKAKADRLKPKTRQYESLEANSWLSVEKLVECVGHSMSVSCVRWHPSHPLLVSASRDGTCRLWQWDRPGGSELLPLSGTQSAVLTSTKASVGGAKAQCRACCFSSSGKVIYTAQGTPKGACYVKSWVLGELVEGSSDIECIPYQEAIGSKHLATNMSVRDNRLAVGDVEGRIHVLHLPELIPVAHYKAHDLPTTCLEFAPSYLVEENLVGDNSLFCCSPDGRMSFMESRGSQLSLGIGLIKGILPAISDAVSLVFKLLLMIIIILSLILMGFMGYKLIQEDKLPPLL